MNIRFTLSGVVETDDPDTTMDSIVVLVDGEPVPYSLDYYEE